MTRLVDHDERVHALGTFDRNLLVEAGAGSGKTALMAGRIALLLASGVPPASVAAITFTELAAAELAERVQRFVHQLLAGEVDVALRPALPTGLTPDQRSYLAAAAEHMDDLTCTTIHGFAHELIRPYPSEADVDPGATVLDPDAAELLRADVFRDWLHSRLGAGGEPDADDAVAAWILHDGVRDATVERLRKLVEKLDGAPPLRAHAPGPSVGAAFERVENGALSFKRCALGRAAPDAALARAEALTAYIERLAGERDRPAFLAAAALAERKNPAYAAAFTKEGALRAFGLKGAWRKVDPLGAADAEDTYDLLRADIATLHQAAADHLLAGVARDLPTIGAAYRERKRRAALIDFDDMLDLALAMLRDHDEVRRALAQRYRFVLIDEFQDTDPRQAEIVWRLTGEPSAPGEPWERWRSRPGARFVVGDPKQAIYRFRGADVHTYLRLRDQWDGDLLRVRVNFRSLPDILEHANRAFAAPLTGPGQPGYDDLVAHRQAAANPAVRHLRVPAPDTTGTLTVSDQRDAEAAAVAALCAAMLREPQLANRDVLAARDIALLAPAGTELWLYERALERAGVAVVSQAGKGLFRRQEVKDLVALTRALADPRDTLALGALLRGPLVGVRDEDLLDAAHALREATGWHRLRIDTDPALLPAGPVRDALERLAPLARRAHRTTPHALMCEAMAVLDVRPQLQLRHAARAERALANLDLFLQRARAFASRGLRAFAHDVWRAWADAERTTEGRPDPERDAVTLITVHAAKGLEWPVVIPINTVGSPRGAKGPFLDRDDGRLADTLFGRTTSDHDALQAREQAALEQECVRLWYVAATRACDLLVLPVPDFEVTERAWLRQVDWPAATSEPLEPPLEPRPRPTAGLPDAAQTRDRFEAEAKRIAAATPRLRWERPSRHAELDDATIAPVAPGPLPALDDPDDDAAHVDDPATIAGRGVTRGLLLHALLEELVHGLLVAEEAELTARAGTLLARLSPTGAPPDPGEVARSALRAWLHPEVRRYHGRLVAELDVAGSERVAGEEVLTTGIADALALAPDGRVEAVIDWKSDVRPSDEARAQYREQVRRYLRLVGADKGLVVYATVGVVEVV